MRWYPPKLPIACRPSSFGHWRIVLRIVVNAALSLLTLFVVIEATGRHHARGVARRTQTWYSGAHRPSIATDFHRACDVVARLRAERTVTA